jgi:methyl-accepting chemotaxis protein
VGPRQFFTRRLQLGFACVVATTLLGMAAIFVFERRMDAALESSQTALQLLDDFKEVQILLATARAAEREFLLEDLRTPNFFRSGGSAVLDAHAASLDALDSLLWKLAKSPDADELQVSQIQDSILDYRASFSELVSLYRERGSLYSGALGQMREAGFGMQEVLEEAKQPLQVRVRAELFQLDGDLAAYLRDLDNRPRFLVDERLDVIEEEAATLAPARSAAFLQSLAAYREAWQKLLALDDRIGRSSGAGMRGRLRAAQQTVVPMTQVAVARAHARFLAVRGDARTAAAAARTVSLGAVALAAAIGCFMAVTLGRRLRGSLSAVVTAVEAYAAGDRNARVGRLSHPDEFAVLGGAFDQMAQTLAETTDELEEINASLELAVKGDTAGLMERIRSLVTQRQEPGA